MSFRDVLEVLGITVSGYTYRVRACASGSDVAVTAVVGADAAVAVVTGADAAVTVATGDDEACDG